MASAASALSLFAKILRTCYSNLKMTRKVKPKKINMLKIMSNPRYRGRHIIAIAGKIFTAKTGTGASKILEKVEKKYPTETPAITYIPKEDTLILWL